jgi:hypothetical protein
MKGGGHHKEKDSLSPIFERDQRQRRDRGHPDEKKMGGGRQFREITLQIPSLIHVVRKCREELMQSRFYWIWNSSLNGKDNLY